METAYSNGPAARQIGARWLPVRPAAWFLFGAALIFMLPSLLRLARDVWTLEQGAQGPIILASGLWLLTRESWHVAPDPPALGRSLLLLVPLIVGYLFARVVGILWAELLFAYAVLVWVLYMHIGWRGLARLWFPLVYFLFLIPPPYALIAPITHSRKLWLSVTSVDILAAFGFDVAHNGTTLYIDQYELRIADACAGLNSRISLLTVGLLYVYLRHRADWLYAGVLVLLMLPIAMFANLARILILMLVSHYAGAAATESVLHQMAGLLMFLIALVTLIGVDALLFPLRRCLARG